MATQQLQLVCDASTLANFIAWAQPISNWMRTCGYTNTSDTGQVNWSTISTVPGSNVYVYDIFQSNDPLTRFFVKLEYGNVGSANSPNIRVTLGTGSNGSGALSGLVTAAFSVATVSFTAPSAILQYECNFTGDSANSRIGVMMWRNAPGNQGQELFAIERSLNSSGSYTGTYVTLWSCGTQQVNIGGQQQTLHFTAGPAPLLPNRGTAALNNAGWDARVPMMAYAGTGGFNGSIPVDNCAPFVGYHDYPCTMVGIAYGPDLAEGVLFQTTLYGSVRTYMPSKIGYFSAAGPVGSMSLYMRYD